MKQRKEMKKTRVRQKQKIDTYSGYDLCQNCYHKRELHLGVCMLENDKQFPCDCIEFKEERQEDIYKIKLLGVGAILRNAMEYF